MEMLKDHMAVAEMLRLMEENGRQDQAAEFARLIAAVDSIAQQHETLMTELRELRQQLEEVSEPRHPVKDALSQAAQRAEHGADDLLVWLLSVRDHIISAAETAVSDFKRVGVSALDKAVSAMHVQDILEEMREKTGAAMGGVSESIHKVEDIGRELRSAGGHLKNAGRAASGKETQQIDGGQGGRFQKTVLAPLRAVRSTLDRIDRTISAAQGAVDRLDRAAEQGRGKRERASVRRRLKKQENRPAYPPAGTSREAER